MGFVRHLPGILRRAGVARRGVIHVGAHVGQEATHYARFRPQLWIEPQPEVFARLVRRVGGQAGVHAVNVACGEHEGEATMHILANNDGQSNSLLEPTGHLVEHPEFPAAGTMPVRVRRLDDVLGDEGLSPEQFSLLAMDVQGYELHVLRGAERVVRAVEAIAAEVSTSELYRGGVRLDELDDYLRARGFVRTRLRLDKDGHGYGDGLYIRDSILRGWERLRYRVLGSNR